MRRAPLVLAVLALAAGIAAGISRPVPSGGGPFLLPAALAGAAAAVVIGSRRGGVLLLALMAVAGGILGNATRLASDRSCAHRLPDHEPVQVTGTVLSVAGPGLRLRLDSVTVRAEVLPCGVTVPARWQRPDAPGPGAGAVIEAEGRWWSPPGASAALGRPGALLLDTIAERATTGGRGPPLEWIRARARARLDDAYGEWSGLAASLLLAQRDGLDREVRDRYARAGLSHLLAISGLHVGLMAGILLMVGSLLRLKRRAAALAAAAGTLGYVLLLGAPHSAARAALQVVLLLAARMAQRPTRPEALVAAAALVLLALDPAALLSAGFQMSFAGVAGLLALRPPILRMLRTREAPAGTPGRAWRWLADGLATSIAATLATAPIVAWHFGRVAPVGIAANLLAIPLLSLIVPVLALSLLAAWVWPGAGSFLAGTGSLSLALLDRVSAVAAGVPGGTVAVQGSTALALAAAVAAGYALSVRAGRVRPLVRVLAWGGVTGAVLLVAPLRPAGDRLEVHMIDVGQGDALAIRTPVGRWLLVDAGVAGRGFDAGDARLVPYLARRGVRQVEALVLTHPHLDHTGGAEAVLRSLRPRWVGDPASPAPSVHYLALLRSASAAGVPWVGLRQGLEIEMDGVTVTFLHPSRTGEAFEDANDVSVVLRIAYGEFAALLTGDATASVEAWLVHAYGPRLRADVLKVGHHGSATSTTPAFLAAVGPATALVSAGRNNRYGHPHAGVLNRLEVDGVHVARTDRHGSVRVRADSRGRVRIDTERGDR